MEEKKKERNENLEYINSVWHKLTWWQQKKIYFTVLWYAKTRWFREIPIRWVDYKVAIRRKNEYHK